MPGWLRHQVQPIAVSDVLRAMVEALPATGTGEGLGPRSGAVDIGGPDVLPYADLLAACSRASGLLRVRVPTVRVPAPLVGLGAAALSAAPFWTVTALIASLRRQSCSLNR